MLSRRITAAALVAATGVASAVAATNSAAATATTAVPDTAPAWTAHATHLGRASGAGRVSARVYLAPNGGTAALTRAATAVSTPGTAQYRHFLTPAQYRAQFGTTAATVRKVSSFLTAAGLHVTGVGAGNRYVSVNGSVTATQHAFSTTIERYRHRNKTVQAPSSALRLPAALASSVLTVTGVDTERRAMAPASAATNSTDPQKAPGGFRAGKPCSAYYGQLTATQKVDGTALPTFDGKTLPFAVCGYTGEQLRQAYEGATPLDGTGVTVAITDAYASPTMRGDAATYAANTGGRAYAPGQYIQTKPTTYTDRDTCTGSGWYGEESLDVEAVHAMAPGAKIHYYGSSNCYDDGFLQTFDTIVDEGTVQLVTNSWGDPEDATGSEYSAAYEQVFAQGALEGISFMFSSGDDGDQVATTKDNQPLYPASDPLATAVGGTSTAIGADSSLEWQTGWGTHTWALSADSTKWTPGGFIYGAGGGPSHVFTKPGYQVGVPGLTGTMRNTPDVAMDADPNTGMLVGETQIFPNGKYYDQYRIGGTSLASPLFAGMTALRLQSAGHGAGLLNPVIYSNRKAFTDIVGKPKDVANVRVNYVNGVDASGGLSYVVRSFDQDSTLRVRKGWDDVTGVGVPNTSWLSGS